MLGRCLGALGAAAGLLCSGQAGAAIVTHTVVGTVTTSNGADPRFPVGQTIDFDVSWDSAQVIGVANTPYFLAPMTIAASVNGASFNIGSDIDDGVPVFSYDLETNPIYYAYYIATPGQYPARYDPNAAPWYGYEASDFQIDYFSIGAPLVIFTQAGITGLVINSDGSGGDPGFYGGTSVYGSQNCLRPDFVSDYVCAGEFYPFLGDQAVLRAGYYPPNLGTWPGGISNLTLDYGSFARPAPEPGAWALMLLGFGGVGAAIRRRRALAVT